MIVRVQKEDFDISKEVDYLKSNCEIMPGAISIFIGYVRDFSEDKKIKSLLIDLLKIDSSQKFTIDELPVEEAMKSFFINPDSFLK